jgi:pantoate--beta-alanine ligase
MSVILKTPEEARRFTAELQGKTLALVPTMGFLHEGHLSLMREGTKRADVVAATLFVNPTQFGPSEDLTRYPRDLEGDIAKCKSAGVLFVYAPEADAVYPKGYQTYVNVEGLTKGLDGEKRPGHFRGVATVVTKLLCLFRPEVALFGEKDYQQLQVIRALARDLELGVEIIGLPTVRESDGLAMSSRNTYLTGEERQRALALSKGLHAAQNANETDAQKLKAIIREHLSNARVREDYVEIVDAETLEPVSDIAGRSSRALVAGFVGTTRLIDNVAL